MPVEQIRLRSADPRSADAQWAMRRYFEELDQRFAGGFVVGDAMDDAMAEAADRYRQPHGVFLLAHHERDEAVVACGAVVFLDADTAEVKRMWVAPAARGAGLGRRVLGRLEDEARRAGRTSVVLDTNAVLTEAVVLYEQAGYQPTDPYNDNPHADRWFRKSLDPSS